jgi:alpha-beta hydrolase superfamily lysophospholipase
MNSAYMLHTGGYLVRSGFDVFRLNLRDHGPSHHTEPGALSRRLKEEVIAAAARIGEFSEGLPYFILGFSLVEILPSESPPGGERKTSPG